MKKLISKIKNKDLSITKNVAVMCMVLTLFGCLIGSYTHYEGVLLVTLQWIAGLIIDIKENTDNKE